MLNSEGHTADGIHNTNENGELKNNYRSYMLLSEFPCRTVPTQWCAAAACALGMRQA
jgi:hypothetical protein